MTTPGFKLKGAKAMQDRLNRLAAKYPDRVKGAIRIEAELIMTDSKQNYVPVDKGTLRASGYVSDPVRKGKDISVEMGYGGTAEAYAIPVHEYPSEFSPPSWEGGDVTFTPSGRGPKYLEKPLKEALKGMEKRLADRLSVDKTGGTDVAGGGGE